MMLDRGGLIYAMLDTAYSLSLISNAYGRLFVIHMVPRPQK